MTTYDLIQKHEGLRLKPYTDTVGKLTIGYGRNLTTKGISNEEAELLFANDVSAVLNALATYDWYNRQTDPRKAVLADMAFNMGLDGLLAFKTMIGCLMLDNHAGAAASMRSSKWATQVGNRAIEDCAIMESGDWPPSKSS